MSHSILLHDQAGNKENIHTKGHFHFIPSQSDCVPVGRMMLQFPIVTKTVSVVYVTTSTTTIHYYYPPLSTANTFDSGSMTV